MSSKWLSMAGFVMGGVFLFGGCIESDGGESSPKGEHSMLVTNAKLSYDNETAIVTGFVDGVETRIVGASIEISDDLALYTIEKCFKCDVDESGGGPCEQIPCPK
jgi:hypothetical protein